MERRVRIASRNGLPYANAPVLIITLREGPIRHSVGCGQSIQGLATQGCLLVFSEPEPQFRSLTVILEFSRKKLYADCFGFSIVQLFWRFPEKNCTPAFSVFRSYSYFGVFSKKTVLHSFRYCSSTVILEFLPKKLYSGRFGFCSSTVILEFSRKKLYSTRFGFSIVQLFWSFFQENCTPTVLVFQSYRYFEDFPKKTVLHSFRFFDRTVILKISRKKLYADCFGVCFHAFGSKCFGSGGIICTARTGRPAAFHRHSGMPCERECDSYQISQRPATSAQGCARERAFAVPLCLWEVSGRPCEGPQPVRGASVRHGATARTRGLSPAWGHSPACGHSLCEGPVKSGGHR